LSRPLFLLQGEAFFSLDIASSAPSRHPTSIPAIRDNC
jgi:hypothetical protein